MNSRQTARRQIIQMIERHAINNNLSFYVAAQEVIRRPELFDLMLLALGTWYTGKYPENRVIRHWRPRNKVRLAKEWPNLSEEQIRYVQAYLPPARRPSRPSPRDMCKSKATALHADGKTHKEIAAETGVALKTLYRWFPVKRTENP